MSAALSNPRWVLRALRSVGHHKLSLHGRLVLLVVANTVPLLAFILGYQYFTYLKDVSATGRQTLALARSMSQVVEQELQSYIAALQALTSSRSLEQGDFAEFRRRAETVVAHQFPGANILVLREDGQQILNTILPLGAPLPVRTNLESTRKVFATGRPVVSGVYQGAVGPRPVVAIDVPVTGPDGKVVYVLSLNPRLGVFADLLRRQSMPASWLIGVVDRRGVLIARVPDGGYVGREAAPTLLGPLQREREGIIESTSLEGISLLTVFSHTGQSGWAVAIGVPKAEMTGPALVAATQILAAGSVLLAVSLVVAGFAARRIAEPIRSLRRLAVTTDHDVLPDLAATGLREVDEIIISFQIANSQRRKSEQAEEVLRGGIEVMPEGFAVFDNEDRIVMCNESYRALFPDGATLVVPGVRYEDLLRAGLSDRRFVGVGESEEEWLVKRIRQHRTSGAVIEQQLRDGRWVLATQRRLSRGWITSLVVDITALKAAEAASRTNEERFRRVIEAAPSAMVMIRASGQIEMVNAQAEQVFGHSRTELLGQPVEMLVPERFRGRHSALRGTFFSDPQSRPMGAGRDLFGLREDGTEFPLEIGLNPIDLDGEPMVLASIIDITARHENERERGRQRRELERSNADLEEFAYIASHDLKEPLRGIANNAKFLREDYAEKLDQEGINRLSRLGYLSQRMEQIINDLLYFSRLGHQELAVQMTDLDAVIRDIGMMSETTLKERNAIIVIPRELPRICCDKTRITEVFRNLITNAVKYNDSATKIIEIGYRDEAKRGDVVERRVFYVKDNGIGVSEEFHEDIFRLFKRLNAEDDDKKGTGVGLTFVRKIVERHGGQIWLDSVPGKGSTFCFTIEHGAGS
jgi:two-component system sensor kinase FixL